MSLQVLMQVMLTGLPEQQQEVRTVQAYFTTHDELSVEDGLLFTLSYCTFIQKVHNCHMETEGSLRKAREAY